MRETGARFVVWDNAATLDLAIDRLIELHAMRWEGRTERHAFSSTAYVGFHREVMHEMFARQMLRLYALEVAGTVVAMLYCYRFRDGIYYFQGGFDPGLSKLSPGSVLLGLSIESAIAEGCKVFDMLRGMHDYKAQWARQRHQMMELELFRTGLTSSLYRLRHDIAPRLKRGLEDLVGASR
jgi:CelD/BcsL family acetyltransferase involved in cellulose biosynthesis